VLLISGYRAFPPNLLGKSVTFLQIFLVFGAVLNAAYPNLNLYPAIRILSYVVATLTVLSGFVYSFSIARGLSAHSA